MNIKKIGNYTIIQTDKFKQIYSDSKMLQVMKNKAWLVDLENNKVLKEFVRELREIKR